MADRDENKQAVRNVENRRILSRFRARKLLQSEAAGAEAARCLPYQRIRGHYFKSVEDIFTNVDSPLYRTCTVSAARATS